MKIEVIAIGNEILSGFVINTNAAFLSEALLKEGWRVQRHTVLPDDEAILKSGLEISLNRSDIVICTGGLGPTCDDITRKIAADIFGSGFHFDEKVYEELNNRYGGALPSLKDQATVPDKAIVLRNPVGTAPGLIFKNEKSTLILLPGVPPEMKTLWAEGVLPYLRKVLPAEKRFFNKRLNIFDKPESTVDPILRQLQVECPNVEFGIYPGQKLLGVHMSTQCTDAEEAHKILEKPYKLLFEMFGENAFDAASGKIEEAIHNFFISKKLTLSLAESCSGGTVSSKLTKIAGASQYFLGSLVVYSNELKSQLLNVPKSLIEAKGAVSEEVVEAMLSGLLAKINSDYGAAVTGIAGPSGGTPEKPVGTIWCAVGKKGVKPHIWKFRGFGSREMVIERSANILLSGLLKYATELEKK